MANILSIPNYLKASSPTGLRRLMYKLQVNDMHEYRFFDVQFVNGYWFAWYVSNPVSPQKKMEVLKDLTKEGV